MKYQLVYPMTFYFLYVFGLGIYSFIQRFKAMKSGELTPKYFKTYKDKSLLPERLLRLERHLDNQFQLPVYFYIVLVAYMVIGPVDGLTLFAAWFFVALRLVHSYIHLGKNHLPTRAAVFFTGVAVVALLWIRLAFFTCNQS